MDFFLLLALELKEEEKKRTNKYIKKMDLAPVILIVDVVSPSNTYKPDAGMSDIREVVIVFVFTDQILAICFNVTDVPVKFM